MKLRQNEWKSFGLLLDKGYSIDQSLQMMGKDNLHFATVISEGMSMDEILKRSCRESFYDQLQFFMRFLPLSKSVSCASRIYDFRSEIQKKLWKQSAYPLFLFTFSYLTLYLFCVYVIPQMQQGFSEYTADTKITILIHLVTASIWLLGAMLLLFFLLLLIMRFQPSFRYSLLCRFHRIAFLPAYYSFLLGGYLKEMHQSGLSTKVCFQHLSSHQHSDVLQKIASCISSNLEAGIELLNALQHPLIDHQLIMYLSIGSAAGNLEELLDDYMFLQETRWLFWLKRITACITLSAYSFVGIAAVCIYRMMLIPLELLNTF